MWGNARYSYSEQMSMQQDAMRRVREMQERARKNLEGTAEDTQALNEPPLREAPAPQEVQRVRTQTPLPAETAHNSGDITGLLPPQIGGAISRVLDALGLDSDKVIIIALILILLENDGDRMLIIALGYLLLA